jgi:hypothetical protein
MEHSNIIVNNIFNILAIATSVATFFPALVYNYVYNYSRELTLKIDDGEENGNKFSKNSENTQWVSSIVGFTYTLDLILTLMMFFIFFTAINNFALFIFSEDSKNWLISAILLSWMIFIIILSLLWVISFMKTKKFKQYWQYRKPVIHTLFILFIMYAIIEFIYGINLCMGFSSGESNFQNIELIMASISTIMVILSIILWMIPLIIYSPLFKKINLSIDIYDKKEQE